MAGDRHADTTCHPARCQCHRSIMPGGRAGAPGCLVTLSTLAPGREPQPSPVTTHHRTAPASQPSTTFNPVSHPPTTQLLPLPSINTNLLYSLTCYQYTPHLSFNTYYQVSTRLGPIVSVTEGIEHAGAREAASRVGWRRITDSVVSS